MQTQEYDENGDKDEDEYRDPMKWWPGAATDRFSIVDTVVRYVFARFDRQ